MKIYIRLGKRNEISVYLSFRPVPLVGACRDATDWC